MNLRNLSDKALIERTTSFVKEERELLLSLLFCFLEIQRRRLFCDYECSSLFDMATRHFGYSSDQACRRISAMKLLRELPEVADKIATGELNLTNLDAAQTLFRQEAKIDCEIPRKQKLVILEEISAQSTRDAERILISHSSSPQTMRPDKICAVSQDEVELKFWAKQRLVEKIKTLKGLYAHSDPDLSLGQLFEKLCDLGLDQARKYRSSQRTKAAKQKGANSGDRISSQAAVMHGLDETTKVSQHLGTEQPESVLSSNKSVSWLDPSEDSESPIELESSALAEVIGVKSRPANSRIRPAIRASVRRIVFSRAADKCENCRSSFALQIEHIIPFAMGGSDEVENLRVLCRNCNQRSAIQAYGERKMEGYIR